ncbi:MAG: ferredoxin [Cognaticolwellia sp.]
MTPFGIRKRLKRLLGLDPSESNEDARPPAREKVTLILVDEKGEEQTYQGGSGDTPLFISGNMAKPIGSGCNDSSCATCRVEILEGHENVSPQGPGETETLLANAFDENLRLACRMEILQGSVKVRAYEFLEI